MPQFIPRDQDISFQAEQVIHCYNNLAEEYARLFFHELDHKPFDQRMLRWFAELVPAGEEVWELGCGTGQIACFLHKLGVRVSGLDIAPGIVATAQRLSPDITFRVGDMLHMPLADKAVFAIAAFYAIVHFGLADVRRALTEMARVIKPGGYILLAFHIGTEIMTVERVLDQEGISVDFRHFAVDDILAIASAIGLASRETLIRYPYPEVEYPSRRAYLLLQRPTP